MQNYRDRKTSVVSTIVVGLDYKRESRNLEFDISFLYLNYVCRYIILFAQAHRTPLFVCSYKCTVCTCIILYMSISEWLCTCGGQGLLLSLSQSLSSLYFEARSLNEPSASQFIQSACSFQDSRRAATLALAIIWVLARES